MVTRREDIVTLSSSEFLYRSTHWALIRPCFQQKRFGSFRILLGEVGSDTKILFLFKFFFIHISHVPFFNPPCRLETFFVELLV